MNNNQDSSTSHPEDISVANHQNSISTQIGDIQQPTEEINANLVLLENDEQNEEQIENQQTIQVELNSQILKEAEQNQEQEIDQLIDAGNIDFPIQEEQIKLNITNIEKEKTSGADQHEETEEENILNRQQQADHLQYLANQKALIEGMTLKQREQLMYGDILRQLAQRLQWSHNNLPIHARTVQDAVCEVFSLLFEGSQDAVFFIIHSQFLKEIVILIGEDIPTEEVKLIHLQGIHHLTENGGQYDCFKIFNHGVDKSVAKVLKSTDQEVVEISVSIILKIINCKIRVDKTNQSQLYSVLERDGVIHALCQDILMREEVKEKMKNDVAISLGSLFTIGKISQQVRQAVIIQLKKGLISKDKDIMKTNKDEIIIYSLKLITTLLEFGTGATKEEVINKIPQDILYQLKKCGNIYNQQLAQMINSWIKQRNKMLKLAEINKQIKLNNEYQISIMIEQGIFKDVYASNELMKEEDDNDGVILFACQTLINLYDYNQLSLRKFLKDDYFVNSLFSIFHSIPIDQIMPIHIECLQKIVFNSTFNMNNFNNCKKRIIEIWNKILNSQNEEILEIIQSKLQQLKQGQQHPYRDAFITNGTVARLIQLFQQQNISNLKIKQNSAIILGSLFKAVPIPIEFRSVVINQLKIIKVEDITLNVNNQQMNVRFRNDQLNYQKLQALTHLAECKNNLEEIFMNQFSKKIVQRIRSDNKEIRQNAFQFLGYIIKLSNNKIKAQLFADISLDEIKNLANSNDIDIKDEAQNLLQVMKERQIKLNKQESIQQKQERMKRIFSQLNQEDITKFQNELNIAELEEKFEQIKLLNISNNLEKVEGLKLKTFNEIENSLQQIITLLQQEILKEDKVNENENNREKGKYEIIEEVYEKIMIFLRDDLVWSKQTAALLMKSQIPQQIILLLYLLPLDDICLAHVLALSKLIIWTNNEEKLQLFKLGVIDSMIIILESTNYTIFNQSTFIIISIIQVLQQQNLVNELSDIIITLFSKIDQNPPQEIIQNHQSYWSKLLQFLSQILQFAPPQTKVRLYQTGIIQQFTKVNITEFNYNLSSIISDILIAGANLVVEGQQHPWFDDLETDGTIQTLINNNYNNCVCLLFKAKILPPAIGVGIIQEIIEQIIHNYQSNILENSLKTLCSLVEYKGLFKIYFYYHISNFFFLIFIIRKL